MLRYGVQALGAPVESTAGSCFGLTLQLSREVPDHAARLQQWRDLPQKVWGAPRERVFLDIETAGLAAAPLFLIGLLVLEGEELRIQQFLARDYTEEAAVLRESLVCLGGRQPLVTFNGQSFDLPYILDRALFHRLPAPLCPEQIDLLLLARRAWRQRVPDCRLSTLELYLCSRRRVGDVGGAEVPALYHEFVRTSNWDLIAPALWHNAMDLLTMAELAGHLAATPSLHGRSDVV
jgi:uncharacterized protein YprB with RNaseH-like and TPR domain